MQKPLTFTFWLCLGVGISTLQGCGGANTRPSNTPTAPTTSSSAMGAISSAAAQSSAMAPPSGPPVDTGPPNASGQTPAFPLQTRAPQMVSNISLNVQVLASHLGAPWGLDFLPDGRILITLKNGGMRIVSLRGEVTPITGTPSLDTNGQGGLLDVKVAPDFSQSRLIYFSYAESRGAGTNGTTVARARLSEDDTQLEQIEVIFRQTPAWASVLHFGSRLVWNRQGLLFITLGERSTVESRPYAQRLDNTLGKVVRIKPNGEIPTDNPFIHQLDAQPAVWSYGHRNVQGAALHPATGELWTLEHGPRGGDELNVVKAGLNYGWPMITYGEEYSGAPVGTGITQMHGMEQPRYYWDPVIAPSDFTFYTGLLFPAWQGNAIIGSLNPGGLVRLVLADTSVLAEERLLGYLGRVRDVATGPDGALYVASEKAEYSLVRITPR